MRLEYVMSGMGYILPTVAVQPSEEFQSIARSSLKWMNAGDGQQSFAMLFNAFTELQTAKNLEKWRDLTKLYSDSGGLQMITLAKKNRGKPPAHADIYATQAQYSDYAMCFDEIPVVIHGDKSSIAQGSNRYFDSKLFEQKAKDTAKNLGEQIQFFRTHGHITKPFIIAQGNSYQDFRQWVKIIVEELGELVDDVGGVAMGSSALGNGELEDYIRAYACKTLEAPEHVKQHLHMLGVGSTKRMIPMLSLTDVNVISYDSVSHSSESSNFVYTAPAGRASYARGNINALPTIIADIQKKNSSLGWHLSESKIRDVLLIQRSKTVFTPEWRHEHDIQKYLIGLYGARNFMDNLTKIRIDNTSMLERMSESQYNMFRTFRSVNDDSQFEEWHRHVGRHGTSRPFPNAHPSSLHGLFS